MENLSQVQVSALVSIYEEAADPSKAEACQTKVKELPPDLQERIRQASGRGMAEVVKQVVTERASKSSEYRQVLEKIESIDKVLIHLYRDRAYLTTRQKNELLNQLPQGIQDSIRMRMNSLKLVDAIKEVASSEALGEILWIDRREACGPGEGWPDPPQLTLKQETVLLSIYRDNRGELTELPRGLQIEINTEIEHNSSGLAKVIREVVTKRAKQSAEYTQVLEKMDQMDSKN